MKKTILLLGLAAILSTGSAFAATTAPAPAATTAPAATAAAPAAKTPVACGDISKQVDDAMKGTKLSAAKMKVAAMHDKAGNDLCKAKKDAAADTEFSKVMKMLKKS